MEGKEGRTEALAAITKFAVEMKKKKSIGPEGEINKKMRRRQSINFGGILHEMIDVNHQERMALCHQALKKLSACASLHSLLETLTSYFPPLSC